MLLLPPSGLHILPSREGCLAPWREYEGVGLIQGYNGLWADVPPDPPQTKAQNRGLVTLVWRS